VPRQRKANAAFIRGPVDRAVNEVTDHPARMSWLTAQLAPFITLRNNK
jgi:hypothetical protein